MPQHTRASEDEPARRRHRRDAHQDDQTLHEKHPPRFVHTSRHTERDEHADHVEPDDIESWTLQGGTTRTKRVGKSWHHAFGQADGDAEEGEQQ